MNTINFTVFYPLPFLIIGVWLFVVNLRSYIKNKKVRKWKTVEGEITHIEMKDKLYNLNEISLANSGNEFKLKYSFSINGRKYNVTNLNIDKASIITNEESRRGCLYREDLSKLINEIIKNPKVKVWVNPENPEESVIVLGKSAPVFYMYLGFIFIMCYVIVSILISDSLQISEKDIEVIKWKVNPEQKFNLEDWK